MDSRVISSIGAISDRDDLFELGDGAPYNGNVYPMSTAQIERPVVIGHAAQVRGTVFGRIVTLKSGRSSKPEQTTRTESIYGREKVLIGDHCMVAGHVTSAGEIRIGSNCLVMGDVIGKKVTTIGRSTKIGANVLSEETVNIGEGVYVGGYIVVNNGSLALGKDSQMYGAVSMEDIYLDDNVTVSSPMLMSIDGGLEYDDRFRSLVVGESIAVHRDDDGIVKPSSVYPFSIDVKTFNYDRIIHRLEGACKLK